MGLFDFILDPLFGDDNDPYKANVREVDAEAFRDPNAPERRKNLQGYDNQVQNRGDVDGLGGIGTQADQLAALGRGEGTTTAERVLQAAQESNVANQLGAANAGPQSGAGGLRALSQGIGQGNRQSGIDAATAAGTERLNAASAAGGLYGTQAGHGLTQRQTDDQARQFGFKQIAGEDQQQIQNSIDLEKARQNRDLGVGQIDSGSFDASQEAKRNQTSGILDFLSDASAKTDVVGSGPFSDANAKMNITSDANAKTNIMSDIGTKTDLNPMAFGGVEMAQALSGNPYQTAPAQQVQTFQGQTREELIASGMSEEEVNKALMGQAGDREQFDKASRESLNPAPTPVQEVQAQTAEEPDGTLSFVGDQLMEVRYGSWYPYVGVYGGVNYVNGKPEINEDVSLDDTVGTGSGHPGEALANVEDSAPVTKDEERDAGVRDWTDDVGDFVSDLFKKKKKGKDKTEGRSPGFLERGISNLFSDIETKSNIESNSIGMGPGGDKDKDYSANPIPNPADKITEMAGPIAAIAGMFSDINTKENVGNPEVDQFLDALTPYSYDYKDPAMGEGRQLGVMAQDVEQGGEIGESMVIETPQGKALDGKKMMSAAMASLADMNKRLEDVEMMGGKGIRRYPGESPVPLGVKTQGGGSGGGAGDIPPRKPAEREHLVSKKKKKK